MQIRYLLPLLAAVTLSACGGTDDDHLGDEAEATAAAHGPQAQMPEMNEELKLQGILHVVNDLSRDELLSEAHVEPEIADAILEARASGFRFTTQQQVDDLMSRTVPMAYNPMCSYWQGMAQYYAIRALQCAYSICYPMSPWYGYMAEHYNSLVEAYCK